MWYLVLLDLSLLVLTTLRLTRLVTTDSLGQWWLYAPLYKRVVTQPNRFNRYAKYIDGLVCPFCVGFWIGCLVALSLWLVGGPGDAEEWWRWVTGVFALNYLVGHISAKID